MVVTSLAHPGSTFGVSHLLLTDFFRAPAQGPSFTGWPEGLQGDNPTTHLGEHLEEWDKGHS